VRCDCRQQKGLLEGCETVGILGAFPSNVEVLL
jgi:hypothetical protein